MLTTIPVTSLGDSGPGTLRAAIEQANLDPAQDTITFASSVTGSITLSTALPDLSTNIVIAGPGPSALTVTRGGADGTPAFRIFTVPAGAEITITGLTIAGGLVLDKGADGFASGGGIENAGRLTITDVTISGNSAGEEGVGLQGVTGKGGGIDNSGTLSINDATLSNNTVRSSFFTFDSPFAGIGGGVDNTGTLLVTNVDFTGNTDGIANRGMGSLSVTNSTFTGSYYGAIGNWGSLSVTNSTFTRNGGGGIANRGTASLTDSAFTDNTGGAISNDGSLSLIRVTLTGNSAEGSGGAITNYGDLLVTDSTFVHNTATSSSGFAPGFYPTSFPGDGGGIYNSGTLSVTGSTFSRNSANGSTINSTFVSGDGGGIYNLGTLSLTNATFTGNSAMGGSGGGIEDVGRLSVTFCTFSGNSAQGLDAKGGGIAVSGRGNPNVMSINSIFANSQGGNVSIDPNSNGTFRSLGHNLFTDMPRIKRLRSDRIHTNPQLGPLANNGGPTMTQALLPRSPAINAGVTVRGVTTDQRGVSRPQGTAPDIGAFESPSPPRHGRTRKGVRNG